MLIYYIPIVWLFILSNIRLGKYKNLIEKITIILLGIFLCTTYFNGSDWRQYETFYNLAKIQEGNKFYLEEGFFLYMIFFKSLGFNFWNFFIITKLCCFYIFYTELRKKSYNLYFVLMLSYSFILLSLFVDCPFRNLIAVSIFLYSEKFLLKKKYLIYIFLCFLAVSFHKSAIFMFLLFFIKKISKLKRKVLFSIIILLSIILLNQELLINIIKRLPFGLDIRILSYLGGKYFNQSFFSLGNLEKILIISFILWNKNRIMNIANKNSEYIVSMVIIYFIFYRMSFTIELFGRFRTYFVFYYILGIDLIYKYFRKKRNKRILVLIFFIYSIILVNKEIFLSYKFIPYTSYINYMFKTKPEYEYRSQYNIKKWEERTHQKYKK